jgi:hypothetical protein
MWTHWQRKPESDYVCEVLAFRWLIFRKQGRVGFVAEIKKPACLNQIQQDITMNMSFDGLFETQAQYTEQQMLQAGLNPVGRSIITDVDGDMEFVLPMLLGLQTPAYSYAIFQFAGVRRSNDEVFSHSLSIDCLDPTLFAPDAGFATFSSTMDLADGAYRWLQFYNSFVEVGTCRLRCFR